MRRASLLERLLAQARPELLLGAGVGVVLLLLAAGYLYGIKPWLLEYRSLAEARSGEILELDTEPPGPDPTLISQLEAQVERDRDRLYGGSAKVSLREMESYVIDTLDRIAAQHGTELERVTPGRAGKVLMFDELPFDVELSGSYQRLFEWLWDAESALRPMVVKRFAMNAGEDADGVRLSVRLVAYRAQDPTP